MRPDGRLADAVVAEISNEETVEAFGERRRFCGLFPASWALRSKSKSGSSSKLNESSCDGWAMGYGDDGEMDGEQVLEDMRDEDIVDEVLMEQNVMEQIVMEQVLMDERVGQMREQG